MTDIVKCLEGYLSARKPAIGYGDHIHAINGVSLTETDLREAISEIGRLRTTVDALEYENSILVDMLYAPVNP